MQILSANSKSWKSTVSCSNLKCINKDIASYMYRKESQMTTENLKVYYCYPVALLNVYICLRSYMIPCESTIDMVANHVF